MKLCDGIAKGALLTMVSSVASLIQHLSFPLDELTDLMCIYNQNMFCWLTSI